MRVAIYIRVSTLDQAREGYSLAAQRAALEHWAADRRHEIVRVYEDAGISAKDITHRPAMRRLLWAARRDQYDILLVWALSRLTRSVMGLYATAELLREHNIALVSYTESIDTSTPTGRAMMGMLGVFAQMEREITVAPAGTIKPSTNSADFLFIRAHLRNPIIVPRSPWSVFLDRPFAR